MAREAWVDMSRVLGFATDWFRNNVRVILQYSVNVHFKTDQTLPDKQKTEHK